MAQFPLPVLTAIGHDQDHHVVDMVAYEYLKTPTALADYIISIYEDEDAGLDSIRNRMRLAFSNKIYAAETALEMLRSRVWGGLNLKIAAMEASVNLLQTRISSGDPRKIMERGYALVVDEAGIVLKSAAGRKPGDVVSVMFEDGRMDCRIENVKEA